MLGGCTCLGVYLVLEVCTCPGGVPGPGGCTWSGTPPCGQTHACKNITFATSLRTVITGKWRKVLEKLRNFVSLEKLEP